MRSANPPAFMNVAEEVEIRDLKTSYILPPCCLTVVEIIKRFT